MGMSQRQGDRDGLLQQLWQQRAGPGKNHVGDVQIFLLEEPEFLGDRLNTAVGDGRRYGEPDLDAVEGMSRRREAEIQGDRRKSRSQPR